jgi:hypothetical protein
VLAAVCAATGSVSAPIMPDWNTAVVNLFLEQFARELPAGVHAARIWDGAGFHPGADLVVPSNVSLIQSPPYSPELNPVENLWHFAHHWPNRPYRDYNELQEEAAHSLCALSAGSEVSAQRLGLNTENSLENKGLSTRTVRKTPATYLTTVDQAVNAHLWPCPRKKLVNGL